MNKIKATKVVTICCFIILSVWWIISYFLIKDYDNLVWGASYQIISIIGGISGVIISKRWGGFKSLLGRAILFLSIGLLFQTFGQTVFSYYNLVLKISVPYPSLSDLGFFGSIPFYIYGTVLLSKVSGSSASLKIPRYKIIAVLLPLIMLVSSYFFFLQDYQFDWSKPLTIFLDFGYPLGQACYVSFALLTYILSKNFLGGVMKNSILLMLLGLVIQYGADYNFLTQAYHGTWINGGYGDYIYLVAYFVMSMSLISLGLVFRNVQKS